VALYKYVIYIDIDIDKYWPIFTIISLLQVRYLMIALLRISYGECDSERSLKIGQYLTKLCVDYDGLLFWHTL